MPSNHLILCRPLFLLPSIFSSIRVFSSESALPITWSKYWSFSFNISPSNEHPGLIPLGWTGWISLQSRGVSRIFSKITVQKHPPTSQTPTGTPTTYRYEENRQGTQETAGKQRITDMTAFITPGVFQGKSLSHYTTYWKGPELRQG